MTYPTTQDLFGVLDGRMEPPTTGFKRARIATTANHGLSGLSAIDGITPVAGDRILVMHQTTASENGIYEAASGSWIRAFDALDGTKIAAGLHVHVSEGTSNGGQQIKLRTTGAVTIGSTSLDFGPHTGRVRFKYLANDTFTVPSGVTSLNVVGVGGGGGGGGGGIGYPDKTGMGGGSGGAGGAGGGTATLVRRQIEVSGGDVLTITIGAGGAKGIGALSTGAASTDGATGADTTITRVGSTIFRAAGGRLGRKGGNGTVIGGAVPGSSTGGASWSGSFSTSGNGGAGGASAPVSNGGAGTTGTGSPGGIGTTITAGTGGICVDDPGAGVELGGGGGGGAAAGNEIADGANGGNGSNAVNGGNSSAGSNGTNATANTGCGGGGGGGSGATYGGAYNAGNGGDGGDGGSGFLIIEF